MLIHAINAALEDAEKPFNRISMCVTSHIFPGAMVYDVMFCELRADGLDIVFHHRS